MSKSNDIQNASSLSSILDPTSAVESNDEIRPLEEAFITEESNKAPEPSDDMLNFIVPEPESYEEAKTQNTGGLKKEQSPREAYIAYLIDVQNMSIADANLQADRVYSPNKGPEGSEVKESNRVDGKSAADMVVLNIDKSNVDKVEFTDEEKDKLLSTKVIRLNILEDENLRAIKVKPSANGGKKKFAFLESFSGKLNQYSVPMMNTGDWATFKGAKAYEVTTALLPMDNNNNMYSMQDWYNRQATFIYERFVSSSGFPDIGDSEKPTYGEFINHFKFDDMDSAMFAIALSSISSTDTGSFTCGDCKHQFEETYNIESIYNTDFLSDDMKANLQKIKDHKYEREVILQYVETKNEMYRIQSEETNIIYDLYLPSIAEGLRTAANMNSFTDRDRYTQQIETIAMHVYRILVPDEDGEYVLVGRDDEYERTHKYPYDTEEYDPAADILEMLDLLPQSDYELLVAYIGAMVAMFTQLVKVTCPKCGKVMYFEDNITDKVFTAARGDRTLKDINPKGLLNL